MIDPELRSAIAPVLRDVAATAPVELDVDEDRDGDVALAILWGPSEPGIGLWYEESLSSIERVASVADRVQEIVIKELWPLGRSVTWPPCPLRPDSHPLEATVVASRAVWRCPKSTDIVDEVGGLARH